MATIGFIGLGNLGGPMCRKIIEHSGHEVLVFDLSPAAMDACTAVGGVAAASLADLASRSSLILSSLPMPKDVEAVTLGPGGIGESAKAGTDYIDLTTNSPLVARRVAEGLQAKGIHMIDAPVSGGVIAVEKRTLAIMAGGDKAVLDRHLPVLQCLGDNIIHVGELGAGCVAKLINNMVAFCNMAAGAEGLMLGALAGVNMDTLNQVIRNSSGNSLGYRYVAQKSMSGDYKPTFTTDLAYKDMHLALELADELGMPLALSPQVHNLMRMVRGLGEGGSDVTAMMRVYEHVLGRTVRD